MAAGLSRRRTVENRVDVVHSARRAGRPFIASSFAAAAFSATLALTILLTSAAGNGRSGVKRIVPLLVL